MNHCFDSFWDPQQSLHTDDPVVSECFQHTILVWVPAGFLLGFCPLLVYFVHKSEAPPLPWRWLNILKMLILGVLALVSIAQLLYAIASSFRLSISGADLTAPLILAASIIVLLLLTFLCQRRGIVTSGVIWTTLFLLAVCGAIEFYSKIRSFQKRDESFDVFRFGLTMAYYPLLLVELLLASFADTPSAYSKAPTDNPSPEQFASFPSRVSYSWFTPLAILGWRREIRNEDFWSLNREDTSAALMPKWEAYWAPAMRRYFALKARARAESSQNSVREKLHSETEDTSLDDVKIVNGLPTARSRARKASNGRRLPTPPSILWCLFRCFKVDIVTNVVFNTVGELMPFLAPQVLKLLLGFVQDPLAPSWHGYVLAVALFALSGFYSVCLQRYFYCGFRCGANIRSVLVAAIYAKALRLSNNARNSMTVGEIVNLMSVDVSRFFELSEYMAIPFAAPMQLILCIYFLWQILGVATFAGVCVIILLIPANIFLSSKDQDYQASQMNLKDARIKQMNEILNGIKVLKLYAWEPPFVEQVLKVRDDELRILKRSNILQASLILMWISTPFVIAAVTFTVYVLSDPVNNVLTPEVAFVSLALFDILRIVPMSVLPMMISRIVKLRVSNQRLKEFLSADELDDTIVKHDSNINAAILIQNGCFTWNKKSVDTAPTLQDINLSVRRGELIAVVGKVGCGKSSLLSAILGEMNAVEQGANSSCYVNVNGSIAFVPQLPWIQNATLCDNITFSRGECDGGFYDRVVDGCALRADFEMLPGGDQTEIGEKNQFPRDWLNRFWIPSCKIDACNFSHLLDILVSKIGSANLKKTGSEILTKLAKGGVPCEIPDGVDEGKGLNLSGGQKQRVSLARAVYSNADIYLLDDPLSAVDSHVGKHIFENVIGKDGLLGGKTRILVTHGLAYLKSVDRILVMRDGRISETGTYEELIRSEGAFAEFLEAFFEQHAVELSSDILNDIQTINPKLISQLSTSSAKSLPSASTPVHDEAVSASVASPAESFVKESTEEKAGVNLVETEKAELGSVKLSIYMGYVRAIGHLWVLLFVFLYAVCTAFTLGGNLWLVEWANDAQNSSVPIGERLAVYASLGVGQAFFLFVGSIVLAYSAVAASTKLHRALLHNLLRSPMSFFDVTPLGRIINRCGRDVDVLDNALPTSLSTWIICIFESFSTLFIIALTNPIFLAVIVPIAGIYFLVQRFYISTSRQLKRIESASRSPIYSHFQETLAGASSIRAYAATQRFAETSERHVDASQMVYFLTLNSDRWLGIRLESLGSLVVLIAAVFGVVGRNHISAGLVGLSISCALSSAATLNWIVRVASEIEANIIAVERIREYSQTPTEAEWATSSAAKTPSKEWPADGRVEFEKFGVRYRDGLDFVLRNVSFSILPQEKIGVVGRTGAGKTSLTMGLFRILEAASGRILIDGIDTSTIGLHDLRSRLTIIPQDPVLFAGTLRLNLDPFAHEADDALWSALEHAHLKDFVAALPAQLEHPIIEGGANMSVGQRQLVCLARALLRRSKILVLDEATAAVDVETDDLVQRTIRSEFRDCTIVTIAHRLNTIMDSTRILVLDKGEVVEFDTPAALLTDKKSLFFALAKDARLVSA